ncbi:MAG: LytTR family transcriptional regulator DNA-binding domain-containing protein [Oscillospiraceae bacterium]|nr:LytTR family transcriptional regulator DNA-binding domain-containing protein [Oscillospiraceae bacterium]
MKFNLVIDKSKDEEVTATVHGRSPLTDRIETLVMQYSKTDRIPAYTEDEMLSLPFSEIEYVFSEDGKTFAAASNGKKYRIKMRLYEIEELLPSFFIRINKSALANERRIERFSAVFSGGIDAVFKSGSKEYVSRRCFAEIKRRFSEK